jgi:hypothetical protein
MKDWFIQSLFVSSKINDNTFLPLLPAAYTFTSLPLPVPYFLVENMGKAFIGAFCEHDKIAKFSAYLFVTLSVNCAD